jgi:hypothetical protein
MLWDYPLAPIQTVDHSGEKGPWGFLANAMVVASSRSIWMRCLAQLWLGLLPFFQTSSGIVALPHLLLFGAKSGVVLVLWTGEMVGNVIRSTVNRKGIYVAGSMEGKGGRLGNIGHHLISLRIQKCCIR